MHFAVIARVFGILLTIFSLTLLPPIAVSMWYADQTEGAFATAFAITLVTGLLVWVPVHNARADLRTRDGFVITSLFWAVLGTFGALPFYLSAQPELSITDSIFESISGLTTTGATVITGLDDLPASILYYRQQLQWLGGIGIVVIAVAILPMLGVGGMQLYKAEAPGPVKDAKLTPRITETAKALFLIYVILTVLCIFGFWWAGMTLFDAVGHGFSTVANGGFSTHDASMGFFADNQMIMLVSIFFMIAAGTNFGLHFFAFTNRQFLSYWKDAEFKFFMLLMACFSAFVIFYLWQFHTYELEESIVHGTFQAVSVMTTAGFTSDNFSVWPTFLPFVLLLFGFAGGCAGSTAGGIKSIRVMLVVKAGLRELNRLVHPNAVVPIKLGKKLVPTKVTEAVWGFFAVFLFSFVILVVAVMATGVDFVTALTTVGSCLNNLGPALGEASSHYGDINDNAKWFLMFAMLLGRLEIFTLLVIFTPAFWRH
ncbi:TrkH family potassium uptake protein [Biformimicrobium ophioploci]|uniref:Trk system potassium uptake protein n=1 Tax=Biformimicrobium ophioploci TaxID=3036711 RepID=A0ABQ6LVB8_9GAMM|nr:TrkH family potassium uptake protein [Microbulbifer sp. NKW57]GMG86033.1 TrkH family potassium uptake protein [Microbulbifer sp. NKW57]